MCSVHGTLLQACAFLYGAPSPRRSTSHGCQTADIKGFLDGEIVKTHLLNLLKKCGERFHENTMFGASLSLLLPIIWDSVID